MLLPILLLFRYHRFSQISPLDLLSGSDLRNVVTELSVVASQWIYLGMELGLTQESLRAIRARAPVDSQRCLADMLFMWLTDTVR